MKHALAVSAAALALLFAGTAHAGQNIDKLNGSIHVSAGQKMGDLHTINGSIQLDAGASADGVRSVNGDIDLASRASAQSLETVNGSITLADHSRVPGSVKAVNGDIRLDDGSDVGGHLGNVNGSITIRAAHVASGIETTAGNIDIGAHARIEGGIRVNRQHHGWFGSSSSDHRPRVVIGPDAVVEGTLDFEQPVDLCVSDSAHVGTIKGATAHRFKGDHP